MINEVFRVIGIMLGYVFDLIKQVVFSSILSIMPLIVAVLLSFIYEEYFPDYWEWLTLITFVTAIYIWCKIIPDKYT